MSETEVTRPSNEANRIVEHYVVREGLSYRDAIDRMEREADRLAAPYREAAGVLRRALEKTEA